MNWYNTKRLHSSLGYVAPLEYVAKLKYYGRIFFVLKSPAIPMTKFELAYKKFGITLRHIPVRQPHFNGSVE